MKFCAVTEPTDQQLEAALLALIAKRGQKSSACPSEIARTLSPDHWRSLMPRIRQVAGELALQGLLDISQGGHSVLTTTLPHGPWRGPIRVRLPRKVLT